jgi:hypothetical protein
MGGSPLVERSLLLSLRVDGPAAIVRRIRIRLFGVEQRYIFIRHLQAPPTPIEFPFEINGIVVRYMEESDLTNVLLRRSQPRDLRHPAEAVVATRAGQIVGAAWYTSSVTPEQPWYQVVEPHLIPPARATASFFVVPGDKAAAWAIAKSAADQLASSGVRTIVGVIASHNKRSILMSRLLGSRMVAQMSVRHRFGYSTTVVAAVSTDQDNAITTSSKAVRGRER